MGTPSRYTDAEREARARTDALVGDIQNAVRASIVDALSGLGIDGADRMIDGGGSDGDEVDFTETELAQGFAAVDELVGGLRARVAELESATPGPHITPALMRRIEAMGFTPGSGEPVGWLVAEMERLKADHTTLLLGVGHPMWLPSVADAVDHPDPFNATPDEVLDRVRAVVADVDLLNAIIRRLNENQPASWIDAVRRVEKAEREIDRLTSERDELAATLANERGEGEPPAPGWTARRRGGEARWVLYNERPGRVVDVVRKMSDAPRTIVSHWWDREVDADGTVVVTHAEGEARTMRAAMIAASDALAARVAGGGGS